MGWFGSGDGNCFSLIGFLPRRFFSPSGISGARAAGFAFAQWWTSWRGLPSAYEPTRTLIQEFMAPKVSWWNQGKVPMYKLVYSRRISEWIQNDRESIKSTARSVDQRALTGWYTRARAEIGKSRRSRRAALRAWLALPKEALFTIKSFYYGISRLLQYL